MTDRPVEQVGIVCRKCGRANRFDMVKLRRKPGGVQRLRECECGARLLTMERVERVVKGRQKSPPADNSHGDTRSPST